MLQVCNIGAAMKIETVTLRGGVGKKATVDLVIMALFASLGLATKNIIHPLVATLAGPLYIPTGALAGGIYMMWPVMAYGFVRKVGAATVVSLTQAFISLLLPFGNFGLLSFVIYLAPGLAIDGFFLLSQTQSMLRGLLHWRGRNSKRGWNGFGGRIGFGAARVRRCCSLRWLLR